MKLYAIIDNKTSDIEGMVMTLRHDTEAIRIMSEAIQNERSTLSKFPEDFDLHVIGELKIEKTESGLHRVTVTDEHYMIATGVALATAREEN